MILSMDEIINAVCIHQAERRGVKPTDVVVELCWDEDTGFTAEIWVNNRSQYLIEANLIEAILRYLYSEYNIRAYREQVRLELEDEIIAIVEQ
ncbi:YxcD family protein [Paenibacillus faecalis]|uniref:YxcD family protein n=1 Tax=Paenibacillus faecalis TaxID=2079532 RepID=UPI000D0F8552|nr:YxcD family protein [Paenibacillus faecalis]